MSYYHLLDFCVFHCLFHQQFFPLRGTKHCLLYYESYTGKSKSKKLWLKLSRSMAQLFIKLFAFIIQDDSIFDIVSHEASWWWVRGKTTQENRFSMCPAISGVSKAISKQISICFSQYQNRLYKVTRKNSIIIVFRKINLSAGIKAYRIEYANNIILWLVY